MKTLYGLTPEQHENLVKLLSDTLDRVDVEDFDTRREYLGYVAELSEILEAL